jgi:putative phosphoribosyl transferase
VLTLNRYAASQMAVSPVIGVVRGATHLSEEPGALKRVAQLAAGWFDRYLAPDQPTGIAASGLPARRR